MNHSYISAEWIRDVLWGKGPINLTRYMLQHQSSYRVTLILIGEFLVWQSRGLLSIEPRVNRDVVPWDRYLYEPTFGEYLGGSSSWLWLIRRTDTWKNDSIFYELVASNNLLIRCSCFLVNGVSCYIFRKRYILNVKRLLMILVVRTKRKRYQI